MISQHALYLAASEINLLLAEGGKYQKVYNLQGYRAFR